MKRINKWLSLLLALVLVFGLTAVGAAAEEADETDEPQLVTVSTEAELIAYAQDGIYQIILVTEDIPLTQDITTGDYIEFGGFKNNNEGWLVLGDHTLTANQVTIDIVDSNDFANAAAMIEAGKVIDSDDGLIELAVYGEVEIEETHNLPTAVIILVNNNDEARLLLADGVELACDSINCIENGEWVDALSKTNAYGIVMYKIEDYGDGRYWVNNVLYPTEEAMLAAMKEAQEEAQEGGTPIYGVQLGTYKLPTTDSNGTEPGTITLGEEWDEIDLSLIWVEDGSTLEIDTVLTLTTLRVASMDNGAAAQVIVNDGASLTAQYVFIYNDTESGTAQLIVEDGGSLTINDSYGYSYIQGDLRYGEGATVKLPDGISIDGEYPALLWHWLSGDDDGLYEENDDNFSDSFVINPGDEFCVVFYARTWDAEDKEFVYTAVDRDDIAITSGNGLKLEKVNQDDIHDDQTNRDKFVIVSCDTWNQDYVLSNGTVEMRGDSRQREVAFYSDYDGQEIQLEDYINWYGYNPVQENEFYFALSNDAEYRLTDVELTEGGDVVTLKEVEPGRVYKLTVKDMAVKTGNYYNVSLHFNFANDEDEWDGYDYNIGVNPTGAIAWKDGAVWYDKENHVPDNDAYTASYYDHLKGQLTGSLNLTEGETRDGVVYLVNYDWDAHLWRCDPYPAASIWTSNKDAASLTQILSDWQDWGGLESTLTAGESGTAELYTKRWNEDWDGETDPMEDAWTGDPDTWTIPLTVTVTSKPSKPGTSKPSTGSTSTSTSTGTTAAPELPFTDVSEHASYYDAVKYVYDHDLMNGTSETRFSPSGTLNRAMVATILYRLEGEPAAAYTGTFTDVADGTWYTGGVEWAAKNGIVDGYGNGKFGPTDPVTREQLAAMLYRYARYKGYDVTKTVDLANYTDGANTSAYAVDAVEWAAANGILESANGKLRPREAATRAEVAIAVAAFHEALVK